jgi:hypothetical protein
MSKIVCSSMSLWVLGVLTLSLANGCVHIEREIVLPGDGTSRWGPNHDQTPPEAREIVSANPDAKGIGVFLVPAPHFGPLEYMVTIVPCVTYAQTARRGFHSPAFKFIPEELTDLERFKEMASNCAGRSCIQRVTSVTRCTSGCMCSAGSCASMPALDLERLIDRAGEQCPDIYGPLINPTTP